MKAQIMTTVMTCVKTKSASYAPCLFNLYHHGVLSLRIQFFYQIWRPHTKRAKLTAVEEINIWFLDCDSGCHYLVTSLATPSVPEPIHVLSFERRVLSQRVSQTDVSEKKIISGTRSNTLGTL